MTHKRQHPNVVLLPTYNEKENIQTIVPAIIEAAPVDVWILDDNSPDGTGDLADELVAKYKSVFVTHRTEKKGLGAAYIDGYQKALDAGYEKILQMDADFSHSPSYLPTLLELSEEHDVVLGSRWVGNGGTKNWPWHRRFISRGGSLYARTMLGVPVRDLTGGFKAFRREVLEKIALCEVRATGYAFQIEMTYRALELGFDVFETPIVFVEREDGESKMSKAIVLEAIMQVPLLRLRSYM